jgi:hypothetical protein
MFQKVIVLNLSNTIKDNIYGEVESCRSQWPRGLKSMNRLRPLEHWDRGFESHLRHVCLRAFIPCFCYLCVGSGLATN